MFIREYKGHKYQIELSNDDRTITAISSFAGKTVQGVAKCDPDDTPNTEKFIELAILRCDAKIANKKIKRGIEKLKAAGNEYKNANKRLQNAVSYMDDAEKFYNETMVELEAFEASVK